MGRRKGTKKGADGKYYTPEEIEETKVVTSTISSEEPSKMDIPKKEIPGNKEKFPRIMIVTFDAKGRTVTTTYNCNPETLFINKVEDVTFTQTGKPKTRLNININAEVVEIE